MEEKIIPPPTNITLFVMFDKVRVHVTPTNADNKIQEDSNINYIILPSKTIADTSYIEGHGSRCRQSKISNPYFTCGRNNRPEFPKICPTSQGLLSKSWLAIKLIQMKNIFRNSYFFNMIIEPFANYCKLFHKNIL